MTFTSPVPPEMLEAAEARTEHIDIKLAQTPKELEGVFRLNHQIYAEELGQDVATGTGQLVDRHRDKSDYLIAKDGDQIVGMVAITRPGHIFSIESSLGDRGVVMALRSQMCEFRRLAIIPEYRRSGLYIRMVEAMARYCIRHRIPYALISAIEGNVELYRRGGFMPFDRPFCKGGVHYQPMIGAMPKADAAILHAHLQTAREPCPA